jgi:hypothetical protein
MQKEIHMGLFFLLTTILYGLRPFFSFLLSVLQFFMAYGHSPINGVSEKFQTLVDGQELYKPATPVRGGWAGTESYNS